MPAANIIVLQGHPRDRLRALVSSVSEAMAQVLAAPKERLEVWITEVDPELWGVSGEPATDVLQTRPRREVEMPFVQMVLLEGRPPELLHLLMSRVTDAIAAELDVDRARIRIHIAQAHPDRWGIGGVPASVARPAAAPAGS